MTALYRSLKITAIFLCLSHSVFSQIILGPSIGLTAEPADNAPICSIPTYIDPDMTFETPGLQNGDTVPHFKLYKTNGDSVDLLTVLQNTGKPVLLIGGSITCNVFRSKITDINTLASTYSNDISIYVVYIVEAHPNSPDLSPYSGTVWVPGSNVTDNCLFNQPTTYKQRKDLADTTDARYNLIPEIIIDGPCNLWWSTFATAPNSAFLIEPNGRLFKKHGWFNRQSIYNMADDIDSLLNILSVDCDIPSGRPSVFPNPAKDEMNIVTDGFSGLVEFTVNDLSGRIVFAKTLEGSLKLNLAFLAPGIYSWRMEGDEGVRSGKLIRQ